MSQLFFFFAGNLDDLAFFYLPLYIERMLKRCVESLLERIFVSLCVIFCIQLPFFMTQYTHQLRGRTDELKWQIEQMKMSASSTGKNLDQYIAKFRENPDPDFASQGKIMHSVVHRFEKLSKVWMQLKESSSFTRPFIFFRYLQGDIFSATFHEFKMGISFTFESMIFGLLGIFIGSGLCLLRKVCFGRSMRCKKMTFSP